MGSWRRRGRGGPIGSPAPGGSGRGPAQPGVLLRSSAQSSPPLPRPRAGNVLFPPLPPRGQRAGRAGLCPTLLSSPPRCGPLPPLTHAAPGLARRWVWAGRGVGGAARRAGQPAPPGGRAPRGRAPPAATWPPHLRPRLARRPLHRGRDNSALGPRERGLRGCGKGVRFPEPCQPGSRKIEPALFCT